MTSSSSPTRRWPAAAIAPSCGNGNGEYDDDDDDDDCDYYENDAIAIKAEAVRRLLLPSPGGSWRNSPE